MKAGLHMHDLRITAPGADAPFVRLDGQVPPGQVLVETDAPYLTPHPHRGRRNAGYLMPITVRCIADTLGLSEQAAATQLNVTAELLYGPW